ncbi:hypothetical protein B4099_0229 [Heyndrickxia coagulans]|uniref:Uncharacterized protein n=1 Tax=Heyndrickxia coagulans TaxID=1398 RepID=A0A150KEX1_HEYCO|nr:hypothetical protein B4099_0229 [Heyndrickxia coagulans]
MAIMKRIVLHNDAGTFQIVIPLSGRFECLKKSVWDKLFLT